MSETRTLNIEDAQELEIIYLDQSDVFEISGLDYDSAEIDLIGADLVIFDPSTGTKIILPGLALMLFGDETPPQIVFNGQAVSSKMLSDKMGMIVNVTKDDIVSFTTFELDKESESVEQAEAQEVDVEELQVENQRLQETIEDIQEAEEQAQILIETLTAENVQLQVSQRPNETPENVEDKKRDGEFTEPPEEQLDFTSSDDSSAVSQSSQTSENDNTDSSQNSTSVANFSFNAFLLQTGLREDDTGPNFTVFGGGGVSEATFDPSNDVQLLPETLDYTFRSDDIIINADDTALFDDNNVTRTIELVPTLPDGFAMTSALISGVPAGAEVIGGTLVEPGVYALDFETFPLTVRGNIQFNLRYPVPVNQSFELELSATADFDPSSEFPAPSVTSQTFIATQMIEQRNVASAADLNFTDGDGNFVWVLSNSANGNTILSGSGNDVIEGSGGIDTIQGNAGDDQIRGNDGADVIDGGDGLDVIVAGLGNDTVSGGTNVDLIDYSERTEGITVDMTTTDADGFSNVTIGFTGEVDRIRQIENITGSEGDDTITGNDDDNEILGGLGNDIIDGALGNDTIDGGDGSDTLSFISGSSGLTVNLGTGGTVDVGTGTKTIISIENITATNFDDTITAVDGDNAINGADGDDIFITNGDGNDIFDGGFNGIDNSVNDTLDYTTSANGITVDLLATPDADGFVTLSVGGTTDLVQGVENIFGSDIGGDNITGNDTSQTLRGNGGNDTLNGGQGDDIIFGGAGADNLDGGSGGETATGDTLDFSDLTDSVALTLTTSSDGTALSNGDTDIFSNFERYILTSQDDTINSSSGDDIVSGGDGNDTFFASVGADVFDGEGGTADVIDYSTRGSGVYIEVDLSASPNLTVDVRNSGDDSLIEQDVINNIENVVGSDGNDVFTDGSTSNRIDGGAGSDTVSYANDSTAISFNMLLTSGGFFTVTQGGESDELARIETILGSSEGDTMGGNNASNQFFGNGGGDTFIASAGGDTYRGDGGADFVNYSSVAGLNSVVIDLSVFGSGATSATLDLGAVGADGDDRIDTYLDAIENVSGTSGDDSITGNSLNNVIFDLGGDDILNGGAAGDNTISYALLSGDNVIVDLAAGTADDDSGAGALDSLTNFININGSNLGDTLSGDGNDNIINGNNGNDTITGNAGDDTLNGGNGDDVFFGGAGADTIDGGDGDDRVNYAGASAVTVNLNAGTATDGGGDTDNLTSIEAITGSAAGDSITMGDDTVEVDGEGGNDTITSNIQLVGGTSRIANIDGGADDDTVSYTSAPGITGASITGTIANITVGTNTDIVSNVERFALGAAGDDFTIDTTAITSVLNAFDGNGGSDSVTISGTGGSDLSGTDIDGDTLAGIFTDLEQFDFRGTSITGPDTFDISDSHVTSITGGGNRLNILIDGVTVQLSDFNFLTGGGISNIDANLDPNIQQVQWSSGAELIVSVV